MAATAAAVLKLLLSLLWISILFLSGSLQLCVEKEKKALLNVRSGFPDVDRRLSPWKGDSCCSWEGVGCNNITGHVIELHLSLTIHPLQSGATVLNRSKVHPSLFQLKHLEYLDLSGNNLSGHQIPSSIGSLTQLQHLDLSQCYFGGEIPHQLGNLSNLQGLFLPDNQIEGVIPKTIGNLTALQSLRLSDNQISGKLPDSIGNLLQLEFFDISGNNISGLIPDTFGSLCNLSTINLSYNSITGSVVEFFEQLSRCRTNKPLSLDLHENQFSGLLPSHFERLQRLVHLDLGSNQLSGSVPASLGKLSALGFLSIYSNNLVGDITEAHFANLTNLESMDISNNNLSVKVNQDWLPPFQAQEILMGSCNLGPRFPPWLRNQTSLQMLDISNNGISDAFPDWFWSLCLSEMRLNVSHNHMRGILPRSLECFKHVHSFDLSYNNFEGFIPPMQSDFLDLSRNSFSGPIPKSMFGDIPKEITKLQGLRFLNLSLNHLSGNIPDEIGQMGQLESLDLSENQLSGRIPSSISNLNFLGTLNLSYNNLIGKIPTGTQLQTFTNLSYIGNSALCGEPLQNKCPGNNNEDEEEDMHEDDKHGGIWYFIGFAPGFVFGFWGFMGAVMIKRSTRIKYILIIDRICGWFMYM